MDRNLYKEALHLMMNFEVDIQNVIDILQLNILRKLDKIFCARSLFKLKDRIKKALLDRYFRENYSNHAYRHRDKQSIRGKVGRRLFTFLKKGNHHPTLSKKVALIWEENIQSKRG
jgi:hypothetical protein